MRSTFWAFASGLLVGAVGVAGLVIHLGDRASVEASAPAPEAPLEEPADASGDEPATDEASPPAAATKSAEEPPEAAPTERGREGLEAKLEALELKAADIKEDMKRGGQVVRRKAREVGSAVADAAQDARITAEVKAKLVRDPELSALDVSVSTSDGKVTLSGEVSRPELVGRAILLAYETSGVREVASTLDIGKGEG